MNNQLHQHIIKEIEKRGLVPRPRFHFLLKRSVFWSLAIISIIIGAVSFAVAIYVFFDNEGISTATLLETPLETILQSIPFLWLFVLGLFTTSAYLGLRNTKTGYRYKTVRAVLSVILVSICLGFVLNIFDFGQTVHTYLLNHTVFYDSLIHSRNDLAK